ncbi:folylpolyglutamate synthase/dihydrofolate synthase family protein [Spirosoma sp. SC4-14]|uniref:bifunctional folylpolyglutamate synthase/dihydrofolate synthase n=1 Tax=Spirosoma sp. SC4-14 TaxID=3128900 RepID=UPI0030D0B12D
MQYQEALDYLYSRLPVFHRIGPKALKPGLTNTLRLCEALGNPQQQFRSIHVAGTNGKGSTSHMLAAIYQSAGYRVGLYTSPHLKSFTERIRLNGEPIAEAEVAAFVTEHRSLIESIEPSFFEVTVAMAFDFFARHQPDIAIIEVGLGGRLDSTNVITPVASVITNIGYDHTDILGDTLAKIAREKAGIIKTAIPVLVGETHPETKPVFEEVAASLQAPIRFADQAFRPEDGGIANGLRRVIIRSGAAASYFLDLLGSYQVQNLPAVLATVEALQPLLPVAAASVGVALQSVVRLTGLKGRFQTIQESPRVIADTAHNLPGLQALFTTVNLLKFTKLHIILALVTDKNRDQVLGSLPPSALYYFCQAGSPRSLPSDQLQAEAQAIGLYGDAYTDVNEATKAAIAAASPDDLILITGSNYHIAELTNL